MRHFSIRYTLARCLQLHGTLPLTFPEPWQTLSRAWVKPRPSYDYLTLASFIDWILDGLPDPRPEGNEKPQLEFSQAAEDSPGLRLFEALLKFAFEDEEILPQHEREELFGLLAIGLDNQSEHSVGAFDMSPFSSDPNPDPLLEADRPAYRHNTLLAVEAVTYGQAMHSLPSLIRREHVKHGREGALKAHIETQRVLEELWTFRNQDRQEMSALQLVKAFVASGGVIKPHYKDEEHAARAFREFLKRQKDSSE